MLQTRVGPYRIVRPISQGGMGTVYEALHEAIERKVAIKTLHPDLARSADWLTRFFNEAKAVNRISHPGIVQIFDFGQMADGAPYIVMEYLDGETVGQRGLRLGGIFDVQDVLRLLRQVAAALAAAHAKGIVHRDLKPDNIIIVADPDMPGGERTKLLDFGIAKLHDPKEGVEGLTRVNVRMGTPAYMSPEQCRGAAEVDDKTDVYALGVLLYRLLCGRLPFSSKSESEMLAMQLYQEPPPISSRAPWIPAELGELTHSLLHKDKYERPSMEEVVASLDEQAIALADFVMPDTSFLKLSLAHQSRDHITGDSQDQSKLKSPVPRSPGPRTPRSSRGALPSGERLPPPAARSKDPAQQPSFAAPGSIYLPIVFGLVVALLLLLPVAIWWRGQKAQRASHLAAKATAVLSPSQSTPVPAGEQRVRWEIRTEPPGVEVRRSADHSLLGHTPWRSESIKNTGTEELRLVAPGYEDLMLTMDRSKDDSHVEVLRPLASLTRVKEGNKVAEKEPAKPAAPAKKLGKGRKQDANKQKVSIDGIIED